MNPDSLKIGIAPIGWTNDDLPELGGEITFEQCISEMALAGYEGCEVGTKFPKNPDDLKPYLEIRNLRICNQWFSYKLTTTSIEENTLRFRKHLAFLQAMGADIVGGGEVGNSSQSLVDIPVFEGKGMLTSKEAWINFCDGINALGQLASDQGFRLAFHHHMGSVVQTMEETDRLMENTDPENVWLNYDCGHFAFAGEDPVEALQKYLPRIAHIHLKDVRQSILDQARQEQWSFLKSVKEGVFTVPGDPEGCIDFIGLFALLRQSDYEGWIVVEAEQDPAKANPFQYAKLARTFVRKHLAI
ncbi:MAG: myo-inosose-2 dehydratase [Saprospiraceae bacterium]|nr:myo-inosose-2 dehydratase [Saprospiraceae bacterium]